MSSFWNDKGKSALVEVGDLAPDFALETEDGESWSLSEQRGNIIALLFYPKNEVVVCHQQLHSIRDNWAAYVASKAVIVGISTEKPETRRRSSERCDLPLSLLVDADRRVTSLYSHHWLMPARLTRAIVIIDANGVVRHRQVMLRAFRPSDRDALASIYAARTDYLGDRFRVVKDSDERINLADKQ
ncbi:MAG: peroxiredoxin [Acidobacteriota bacterium]|nr:peroxiredoxin [Acidobacteriota bacterium]